MKLKMRPFGKTAVLLTLDTDKGAGYHERVVLLGLMSERLRKSSVVVDVVAAYDELLVSWRPTASDTNVRAFIQRAFAEIQVDHVLTFETCVTHTISVDYSGQDLPDVAVALGLSVAQVMNFHVSQHYAVQAIGFQPGFAYLGSLSERLQLPRKAVPLTRVPPGSIAIAGTQTAIYPHASPGGWHLIGTTRDAIVDLDSPALCRFKVGDRVEFRMINKA